MVHFKGVGFCVAFGQQLVPEVLLGLILEATKVQRKKGLQEFHKF